MGMENSEPVVVNTPNSSAISSITYHPSSKILYVTMRENGKAYDHPDVPPEEAKAFMESPIGGSHGRHFAKVIRPKFSTNRKVVA